MSDTSSEQTEQDNESSEAVTKADIVALRTEINGAVSDISEHLEDQDQLEQELKQKLKQYTRARQRRSSARKLGPYIVLLYGVGMTIAAFYLLNGWWAMLAMFVVGFSTIGLFFGSILINTMYKLRDAPDMIRDQIS